jgi:hypothetical protein
MEALDESYNFSRNIVLKNSQWNFKKLFFLSAKWRWKPGTRRCRYGFSGTKIDGNLFFSEVNEHL